MELKKADRTADMATFLAVACEGSLSAAARSLGLTPSAVSRVVSRLEDRLGVRLVVRTTRSLRLTPEGKEYALAARRILADLDQVESAIADRASPSGLLRISMAMAHGRITVVPLLKEFLERYPEIQVEVQLSDEVADILGGHVDVGIRFGPLIDSPLTARRIGETGRQVVASPEYLKRFGVPQHPYELTQHNCIDFSFRRIEPGWPFRIDGQEVMLPVSGNLQANNGETLVQLALQGVGITRVGSFHTVEDIRCGRLVSLLDDFNPDDSESIHAVFVGGVHMPARVRVFVDYLVEKLRPESLGKASGIGKTL
ncbi:LysR substrate-binding domain-containing protein [Parathalassolituus penaei]|uniref:LysR substrate-binding domain-containing protein n=1 Tax=Parathalassolituus penaei TaxID=2997323 RepID=A0A9X3EBC5_9GAMM|nr:LysR substrate-binding domain-containing protein [Parathalassolituus penaei]MCY0963709.1 LysR substrate-binding domain-containing protein [Parathalassolituus penaei]